MTWELETGPAQLTNLSHIGIIVEDVEKTARFVSSVWNIGTPEVVEYEPKAEELLVGEPFKVRIAFIKFGPLMLEFLQPLSDGSLWSRFIAEKGEGIHHFGLGVSNYDEMVTRLKELKHPLLVAGSYEGVRWCYFDTSPGGMVIEFREEYGRLGSSS